MSDVAGSEGRFWVESLPQAESTWLPSGCELCQHCQLVRLLGRRPPTQPEHVGTDVSRPGTRR